MIHQLRRTDQRFTVSTSTSHLTIWRNQERVAAFDREGRPFSLWRRGTTWRRGLDGRILVKRGRWRRRWLAGETADRAAEAWSVEAREALEGNRGLGLPDADRRVLERAAAFDSFQFAADREWFRRVYGSASAVSVLPPDAYLSVVVQGTLGCSFNTCTFCNLYQDQGYRVRPVDEFERHAGEVKEFLGDSLKLRPRIFLGEANALAAPHERVLGYLEVIARTFPGRPVQAFVDAFIGARRSSPRLAALRALGLERVSIGLESGHDPLLTFVRKPGSARDAAAVVQNLKRAGIAVNVIVIAGLGGYRFASGHLADTIALISKMALDRRDIIYVSALHLQPGTPYCEPAESAQLGQLSQPEIQAQTGELIRALRRPDGPRVTRYDIDHFVY